MKAKKDADISNWVNDYRGVYEKIAGSYHAKRFGDKRGRYDLHETTQQVHDLLRELHLEPQTLNVLDVACGTGKVSIPLAGWGAVVTCLDASEGMLQQCYQRAVENQVEQNIHLKRANAEVLPFDTGAFDFVISSRFLLLFPPSCYAAFINEMIRAVKPGGYVVVEIENRYFGFVLGFLRVWRRARRGDPPSSAMSLFEIYRLQNQLVDGRIIRVCGCQLPMAHHFSPGSAAAAMLCKFSRTLLKPVSFYYFVVIQKN